MIMTNNLSLEQEFRLAVKYKKRIKGISDSESRRLLLATLKQMMLQDNMIKFFIKNQNLDIKN
uniref:phycytochrome bilisome degradation protein n=1 Tax=Rhodospora sordida TaxID=362230 RepID=UPI001FCD4772|nr:phycytochrome bilisome degradation protein [Rhodospora sordida]UNJ15071.1 phycytochrome bilisome degradation protein [Rhodospora sordida]